MSGYQSSQPNAARGTVVCLVVGSLVGYLFIVVVNDTAPPLPVRVGLPAQNLPAPKDVDAVARELAARQQITLLYSGAMPAEPGTTFQQVQPGERPLLNAYAAMLQAEFERYPHGFLEQAGVRTVCLVKTLTDSDSPDGGLADAQHNVTWLVCAAGQDLEFQRHAVHHEVSHQIEFTFHGDVHWQDPQWLQLNPSTFRYGRDGASEGGPWAYHPTRGFVDSYAMSELAEDKAEVFAFMMASGEYPGILSMAQTDQIIASKVRCMRNFLPSVDPAFDDAFWQRAAQEPMDMPVMNAPV